MTVLMQEIYIQKNKLSKSYNRVFLGMLLYIYANALGTYWSFFVLLLAVIIIWWGFFSASSYHKLFTGFQQKLFIIYSLLIAVMIIRGFLPGHPPFPWQRELGGLRIIFTGNFYLLPYFVPYLVGLGIDRLNFKKLFNIAYYSSLLSLFFTILLIPFMGSVMKNYSYDDVKGEFWLFTLAQMPNQFGFFLLCRKYVNKRRWFVILIVFLIELLIVAISARRGTTVMGLFLFIGVAWMYILSFNRKNRIIGTVLVIFAFLVLFAFYTMYSDSLFGFINYRWGDNSREGMNIFLLRDMNPLEMFFGKGLNGRYITPGISRDFTGYYRYGIETGFLNIVLKGGFIMAIIHVLLLLVPALKALFKSRNLFSKAAAFYIFYSIAYLYPFGVLSFDMHHLIMWILAVMCYSKSIRMMSDEEIKIKFF